MVVRLRPMNDREPIAAITLAQDTSTITACGNDYSFEDIFLFMQYFIPTNNEVNP